MKKFVIVMRHGEDFGKTLTPEGEAQVRAISGKLANLVNGHSMLGLTSTAPRAIRTAELVTEQLALPFEQHDMLWSGGGGFVSGRAGDYEQLIKMLKDKEHQADVTVIVTHYEYVEGFPGFFARQVLNVQLTSSLIDKGTAWVIDCEQKTLTHVS